MTEDECLTESPSVTKSDKLEPEGIQNEASNWETCRYQPKAKYVYLSYQSVKCVSKNLRRVVGLGQFCVRRRQGTPRRPASMALTAVNTISFFFNVW